MEKTRDQLYDKELNFDEILDSYRQALDNKSLMETLKVCHINHSISWKIDKIIYKIKENSIKKKTNVTLLFLR